MVMLTWVTVTVQLGTLLEVSAVAVERNRGVSRYNALAVFETIRCRSTFCPCRCIYARRYLPSARVTCVIQFMTRVVL